MWDRKNSNNKFEDMTAQQARDVADLVPEVQRQPKNGPEFF